MTLSERMDADLDVFFNTDEFAKLATYTHRAGGSELIAVLWDGDGGTDAGGITEDASTIVVRREDVPDPDYGDRVTIGTRTWDVVRRSGEDDQAICLDVTENRRPGLS